MTGPRPTAPDGGEEGAREVLLRIEDLHVQFRTREGVVRAVNGVDLELNAGETLGLVGESGCGKSVTSQSILRILPRHARITRGAIRLRRGPENAAPAWVDLARLPPSGEAIRDVRRRDIAVIFQEPMSALSPVHTIGNQLLEAIRLGTAMAERAAYDHGVELLDRVGIPEPRLRMRAYTFELSGGMRQRAMIAMALASRPRLLIADEPTTAIDVTIQAQILELLQRLQDEMRMSTLIITHNLGVVAELSQRVAVMYLGRIVEIGSVADVFDEPQHPYTQGLIESIPKLFGERQRDLWTIEGTVPAPHERIHGCPFHPRCHKAIAAVCDRRTPAVTTVGAGRKVECLLYEAGDRDAPGATTTAAARHTSPTANVTEPDRG